MQIRVNLSIGVDMERADTLEIDDDIIENMSSDMREWYLGEKVREWAEGFIRYGYEEVQP